ncbi:MAG: HAD-IIA family hydrolase [Acidimicrobiales bacterium]
MKATTWVLDLDGVIWLGDEPVAGSPEAVRRLQELGHRIVFLTNNSAPRRGELVAKLVGLGIEVDADDVVTSAYAAAGLLTPGSVALVCGSAGIVEALEQRGVTPVRDGDADAVVVGFHRDFDYDRLTAAFRAVHRGARLIATNDDPTYPTPDGPVPGGGSILAAVATAAGVKPEVAGKPYAPMAVAVLARLGPLSDGECLLVGDRPSTDGGMARRLGARFGLVLSGVAEDEAPEAADLVKPDLVAPDLARIVAQETA